MTRRQLFTAAIAFVVSLIGWKVRPKPPTISAEHIRIMFERGYNIPLRQDKELARQAREVLSRITAKFHRQEAELDRIREQINVIAERRKRDKEPPNA